MSSPSLLSPEKVAMECALQTFRERVESSLPLRHFTEFHEQSKIEKVTLEERARILVEFMPNIASLSSSCVIPDLVQKLVCKVEEVIESLRKKNQEHKKMTESVMETFIDAHCSKYKIFVEAQLSLNPGLGRGQREFLFEMSKSMMVRSFESEWLLPTMNAEFRLELKAKLEMKLDLIRKQIQGNQTGVPSSSEEIIKAQVPNTEFEMTTSISQYELEKQNKGSGDYLNFAEQDAFSIWNSPPTGPTEGSRAMSHVPLDFSMDGHGQSVDESGESQVVEGPSPHFDDNEVVEVEVEVQPSDLINDEELPQSSLQEDRNQYPSVGGHPGYSEFVNSNCPMFQRRFLKKKLKTKAYLKNHELCCNKGDVMRHRCNKRGENFNNISHYYESHLQSDTDERPFVCQVCSKGFAKNGTLLRHINIHTGKYACNQCSSTFRGQSELSRHLITHSGIRPYECSLCSARFGWKYSRDAHLYVVHSRPKKASNKMKKKVIEETWSNSPGACKTPAFGLSSSVDAAVLQTSASLMSSKASVTRENATTRAGNSPSESFPWNMLHSVPYSRSSTPNTFPTDIPVVDLTD